MGKDEGDRAITGQEMTTVYGWDPVHPRASVAVMVKGKVPVPVGDPDSTPVEAFKLSPGGRVPAVTV